MAGCGRVGEEGPLREPPESCLLSTWWRGGGVRPRFLAFLLSKHDVWASLSSICTEVSSRVSPFQMWTQRTYAQLPALALPDPLPKGKLTKVTVPMVTCVRAEMHAYIHACIPRIQTCTHECIHTNIPTYSCHCTYIHHTYIIHTSYRLNS